MTQELRRLAEAATQGPWIAAGPSYGASLPVLLNCVVVEEGDGDTDDVCRDVLTSEDALYIAAANPAAILSLLDRLEKAEKDPQLTRIQKECLRIGEEIQRAAGYLPEFYELEVYVEQGYGCVYLRNPDGEHATFSDTVDGLSHCITQAIDAAMEASK